MVDRKAWIMKSLDSGSDKRKIVQTVTQAYSFKAQLHMHIAILTRVIDITKSIKKTLSGADNVNFVAELCKLWYKHQIWHSDSHGYTNKIHPVGIPYHIIHLTLGMLLHYLGKLNIQIFCRYSADLEENANKLHFCRL